MTRWYLTILLIVLTGGLTGGALGGVVGGVVGDAVAPEASEVIAASCDRRPVSEVAWQTVRQGPIVLTAATSVSDQELESLLHARVEAHAKISRILSLEGEETVSVVLSPSRAAARAAGLEMGAALPRRGRIEAVLLPGPDSFERRSPGHLLAKLLLSRSANRDTLPLLISRGLPGALDPEAETVHLRALGSGSRSTRGVRPDLADPDPAMAGSFLRYLADRHGWGQVSTLARAASGATPDRATLRAVTGQDLDGLLQGWQNEIAQIEAQVPAQDRAAILSLVTDLDRARAESDLTAYRGAMESFYCDTRSEADREAAARSAISGSERVLTRVRSIQSTGIRNYPEVRVVLEKMTPEGASLSTAWMEHFPEGWKLTWSSDWAPPSA